MKGSEFMYSALDMHETPKERDERFMLERHRIRELKGGLPIPTEDAVLITSAVVLVVCVLIYAVSVIM